jgi:hypothetical protein
VGRPSKLNPEASGRFLQALSAGAYPEIAARFAGWSPRTYYRVMKGRSPAHREFQADVERTLNELELRVAGTLLKAAFVDPRWAMEFLERRFPERWRRGADLPAASMDPAAGDDLVVLDPSLVEQLVPRLLEAGRRERGDPPGMLAESFEVSPSPEPGIPELSR